MSELAGFVFVAAVSVLGFLVIVGLVSSLLVIPS